MSPLFNFRKDKASSSNSPDDRDLISKYVENTKNLTTDLKTNIDILKGEFNYPTNQDLLVRDVYINSLQCKGTLFYIEVMTDSRTLEEHIVTPLLGLQTEIDRNNIPDEVILKILTIQDAKKTNEIKSVVTYILNGHTALIIDGCDEAILMLSIGLKHRSIEKPSNENILKGPKEAFIESAEVNRALIRKQIRSKNLISESIEVGELSPAEVSLMYIKGIADERIIDRVRKRIKQIDVDIVQNTEILEQHIEERPYSLVPSVLYTESPDRVCTHLLEGHVALIMDNSPAALVLPVTFWTFFHTGEEHYQRWAYGNFTRIIRAIAFMVSFLTPAIYVAITNYHREMLPPDILLAIAGTRETIPLPVIAEVLLMDISFELIREASTRIPVTIGPTIGIVGALILGQAAVEANIVSPVLVIIISITGLSSFAIPEISFSYLIRIGKYIALLFASLLGILGVSGFLIAFTTYLISLKSFGIPFLSPVAPYYKSSKDTILRPPIWKQYLRPSNMSPEDKIRKKPPKEGK